MRTSDVLNGYGAILVRFQGSGFDDITSLCYCLDMKPSRAEFEILPFTGLTFDILQPQLIYQAISEGQSGKLANTLLESPCKSVQISIESDGSQFDCTSMIYVPDYAMNCSTEIKSENFVEAFTRKVRSNGREIKERGGNFIFTGSHGTELVMGIEPSQRSIYVSTGIVMGIVDIARINPKLNVSEENVFNALADITEVLTDFIEETYTISGKSSPDQHIEVTPPKINLDKIGQTALSESSYMELIAKIETDRPNVSFDEIGGQGKALKVIESLAFAFSKPDLYEKWGTKPSRGVILHGPRGTGKTLLAKGLASQAGARFLHITASDINSDGFERIISQIFESASTNDKTVIYLDQIDSIIPSRDGKNETTQKITGTLLQNIDKISSNDNVMIVASTTKLYNIDEAILQPGRLDRLIEVSLPNEEGVRQILGIHQRKANKIANTELFDQVDIGRVVGMMNGFSGADIAEIVRRTLEEKVRQEGLGKEPDLVSTSDLVNEIKNYEHMREGRFRPGQYL